MASSSTIRKYPPRLYEVGKTPIQNRSMNHSCFLSNIRMVEEAVGADAWHELRDSTIGVIIKLKELDYTWSAKYVHYFLTNQLAVKKNEIWSLLGTSPIRFSLYEFGDITGLNCEPFDKKEYWDVDHEEFWVEMNVPQAVGPTLKELQALFPICRNWSLEKRKMVGLLCLLSIGIFGISSNSRIPLHCAKRVMDPAAFNRYPWGRVGFKSLVDSIKVVSYEGKDSYTVHGCVHALVIWIFESVPGFGESYGNRIEGADVPLLSWRGSRKRINFKDFCAYEKKKHQKVRVRHMINKTMEDRYPMWVDDEPDIELDNMIVDILNGELNETFWDGLSSTECRKRKHQVREPAVPETVDESPSTKKKKDKEPTDGSEASDIVAAHTVAILGLVESIKNLTAKIENIDVSVAEKVTKALEATIDAKVDARMGVQESQLLKKIEKLEKEVDYLKKKADQNDAHGVGNSKAYQDDGGSSNNLV